MHTSPGNESKDIFFGIAVFTPVVRVGLELCKAVAVDSAAVKLQYSTESKFT